MPENRAHRPPARPCVATRRLRSSPSLLPPTYSSVRYPGPSRGEHAGDAVAEAPPSCQLLQPIDSAPGRDSAARCAALGDVWAPVALPSSFGALPHRRRPAVLMPRSSIGPHASRMMPRVFQRRNRMVSCRDSRMVFPPRSSDERRRLDRRRRLRRPTRICSAPSPGDDAEASSDRPHLFRSPRPGEAEPCRSPSCVSRINSMVVAPLGTSRSRAERPLLATIAFSRASSAPPVPRWPLDGSPAMARMCSASSKLAASSQLLAVAPRLMRSWSSVRSVDAGPLALRGRLFAPVDRAPAVDLQGLHALYG